MSDELDPPPVPAVLAHNLYNMLNDSLMQEALGSRNLIGQAQGILMERLGIDAVAALAYLRRVSSHTNRRVLDLAQDIVETRQLPSGAPTPPPSRGRDDDAAQVGPQDPGPMH